MDNLKNASERPAIKRRLLGKAAEAFAQDFLSRRGWMIKERNWRQGRFAEIDIIAIDPAGTLVFVEVKARRLPGYQPGFANPGFENIDLRKRRKIIAGASSYLAKHYPASKACRFDAIVLYYIEPGSKSDSLSKPEIHHVTNIF